jgi:hypothetical protein
MKSALLGLAVSIAAFAIPSAAAGQDFTTAGFHGGSFTGGAFAAAPATQGWGVVSRPGWGVGRIGHHDGDHHRRHHRRNDDQVFVGGWYGDDWAYYNNRSWEQDSYNDWWHDNPNRAYPAWMQRNQNCDRMWWSGDTLRC